MLFGQGGMVSLLGIVGVLGVVGAVLLVRAWPRKPVLSQKEVAEIADAPTPVMQRRARWGLVIGVISLGVIAAIVSAKGAMTYWDDDGLRLVVVGIFMAGLLGSIGVTHVPLIQLRAGEGLDERDRAVLARGPQAQATLMLLGLATWVFALSQGFHDEGAVPVVYLYLMFGSVVLLMMIGQSLGILLGYWLGGRNAEG